MPSRKEVEELARRMSELELKYAERLRESVRGVRNPIVKAVILAVSEDSVKHSMLYETIAEIAKGSGPLASEEDLDRIAREIENHIKVEEEMIRRASEIGSSTDQEGVRLIARSIFEDEERHHRLLKSILEVIVRRETLTEDEMWEMAWKYAMWHGTPGG